MRKFFLVSLIVMFPFLYGANNLEQDRRIEEEKRRQLRPKEAALQKRTTPEPAQKPELTREMYDQYLDKEIASIGDGKDLIGQLVEGRANLSSRIEELSDDEPLSRGTLGLMICDALDIKGGLSMRMFRWSKRYAHKELVYLGVMVSGSSREYISGKELLVTFIQAINYMTDEN